MNGKLAKEERRNLRREVGDKAAEMVDQVRQIAFRTEAGQRVMAAELVQFQPEVRDAIKKLNIRVDGASEWAAANERAIAALEEPIVALEKRMQEIRHSERRFMLEQLAALQLRGFFGRFKWLVTGR